MSAHPLRSTISARRTYLAGMGLARFRRFAWMLLLVLSAGLGTPALASMFEAAAASPHPGSHVHADGSVHANHGASSNDGVQAPDASKQAKSPAHCPGCLTAAECAVSCFGVGVLPASVAVPANLAPQAWSTALLSEPAGVSPFGDLDPPRPVSVR